ncbi:peptidylprolyl isomerase [Robbsia sp. Bb-Pol-6]|uniref:Peptidyl-prolyl cis-trans isomerase n=1 Tax=Robbsia betulipollinis TaxID=2981849 RepID=A0ABT3ZN98_9BURK|nr:peptidylprolyl isomerase [Robbsia betulipollinis]MCY0387957.1 peptidylprolyl isomerase [Robbsia betulipollinis]
MFRPAVLSLLLAGSALLAPALAGAAPPAGATHPTVLLKTSQGPITLELFPEKAPKTVANFLDYVNHGQYAGTVFHRVIPGFMIQGGGYDANLREKPTRAPIPLEARAGLSNVVGAVAMARTGDPDSATAQFFINTADNKNLDYPRPDGNGYAVFGRVTAGMDVVRKIEGVATGSSDGMSDVPRTPVVIESATVVKQ